MKAEVVLDTTELAEELVRRIFQRLEPLLAGSHAKDDGPLLDVPQLAHLLGVTKQWVYDKVHANAIPHFKVGKYPRFRLHEVEVWVEQRRRGPKIERPAVRRTLEVTAKATDVLRGNRTA